MSIPIAMPEYYSLDTVRNMSDDVLKSITNQNITNRELLVQVSYEILNLSRFVIFPVQTANGMVPKVFFGTYHDKNYAQVDQNFLATNINNFSPYQYMTLMETGPELYDFIATYIPKSYFLINESKKEYVILGQVDNSIDLNTFTSAEPNKQAIINFMLQYWNPNVEKVNIKIRASNYIKRNYVDRTQAYLSPQTQVQSQVQVQPQASPQPSFPTQAQRQPSFPTQTSPQPAFPTQSQTAFPPQAMTTPGQQLLTTQATEPAEIITNPAQIDEDVHQLNELKSTITGWYPLIDKYKDLPTFLLIEPTYIIPILFNPNHIPELRYEKESRVAWRPTLLNDLDDPSEEENSFYEKITSLITYLGIRPTVTIISRTGDII